MSLLSNFDLSNPHNRIIVALDVNTEEEVRKYVKLLKDYVGMFKVGFQLIHTVGGPQAVNIIHEEGGKVFYDCKLHDTTDTMQKSARDIAKMGVTLFNLHASAGIPAMKAVMEVCGDSAVAAVSVLTSLNEEDCMRIYGTTIEAKVIMFATDLITAHVPGLIGSPKESRLIKGSPILQQLFTVTPAIRPLWAVPNDQNPDRIMTPKKAILEAKSDFLVIGRPILQPPIEIEDPVTAAVMIGMEIRDALDEMGKR